MTLDEAVAQLAEAEAQATRAMHRVTNLEGKLRTARELMIFAVNKREMAVSAVVNAAKETAQ